jgi:hypothetical protein
MSKTQAPTEKVTGLARFREVNHKEFARHE